ncbi:GTPase HflX [Albidovulum sediminis]|uniref:GTPase HflX n=1 Tax=Albidovulum sediminis TaxID=3066345 RepID=A0ABT2NJ91_9RHOB|nr:GTPase HflX [Defluviimonas sediminis]MCT8328816.1 GTPase HflX [Defluviimonas sediminis]
MTAGTTGGATAKGPTRALVLHPDLKSARRRRPADLALAEAVALAAALPDLEVTGAEVVRLARPHPGMLFGAGKIAELKARIEAEEVALVLVDGPVSPVQQRNLEREWKVKLLDRTGLILEIFADRAHTREGVLQVDLAALSYQRTRLVRAWTHLERQRGGFGFVGGPGETQIEADRRAIDEEVLKIRRQLAKVVKTRELHRAARRKVPFPIVALVGYTNAGKSTLFNRMTGAEVLAKDMLFATLDPTMRGVTLPSGRKVILSDTVGFISDLPTELVAAFRATLEEVLEADLILHVRDIAHPETEEQAADVRDILESLGVAEEVPVFEVWNKIDLLGAEARDALLVQEGRSPGIHSVSAITGEGLAALLDAVSGALDERRIVETLTLGFGEGRARAWLHAQGVVKAERDTDEGHEMTVALTERQQAALARLRQG